MYGFKITNRNDLDFFMKKKLHLNFIKTKFFSCV